MKKQLWRTCSMKKRNRTNKYEETNLKKLTWTKEPEQTNMKHGLTKICGLETMCWYIQHNLWCADSIWTTWESQQELCACMCVKSMRAILITLSKRIWTKTYEETNLNKPISMQKPLWTNEYEETNLNTRIWRHKSQQTHLNKRSWSNKYIYIYKYI